MSEIRDKLSRFDELQSDIEKTRECIETKQHELKMARLHLEILKSERAELKTYLNKHGFLV